MTKAQKYALAVLLVVGFVTVGYLRDFFAININYHLHHIYFETDRSIAHSFFDFLHQYNYWQIYYSKYLLTAVFTVLNFSLGFFLIRTLSNEKAVLRLYTLVYLVVIAGSVLFFGGGYLFQNPDGGYHFARILMGFLQSPVPAALMLFGYPLYRQSLRS